MRGNRFIFHGILLLGKKMHKTEEGKMKGGRRKGVENELQKRSSMCVSVYVCVYVGGCFK